MSARIPTLSRVGRVLVTAGAITAIVFGTALSASAVGPVLPLPLPTPGATLSGTPDSSNTLTANPNGFADDLIGMTNPTYSFVWNEDGTPIDGANGNTLLLTDAEVTHSITATVTATSSTPSGGDGDPATDTSTTPADIVLPNSVVATTAPTLTGGTVTGDTLTITPGVYTGEDVNETYVWFFNGVDPQTGEPVDGGALTDTGTTHLLTADDLGNLIGVIVTATSNDDGDGNGDSTTTRLVTPTVIIPAAPFATDAGLTAANQGGVTGSVTASTATITVPGSPADGTRVFVYGYSTPTALGFYSVVNGQIVVNFSALPAGAHKLLLIAADGSVLGWFGVSVLAATGASVDPMEWYLAGGALLVGAVLVGFGIYSRRRKASL